MSQGRTPWWASSTILDLTTSGKGRPLTKTPPSWLTPPWPRKIKILMKMFTKVFYKQKEKIIYCVCERKCVFPRIILSNLAHPGECFSPEDEHWLQIEFQMSSELEVEYKVFWLIPPSVESPNAGWLVPQSRNVFWTLNRLSQFKSCIFPFETSSLCDFEDEIIKPWVCEIFRFPTQTHLKDCITEALI